MEKKNFVSVSSLGKGVAGYGVSASLPSLSGWDSESFQETDGREVRGPLRKTEVKSCTTTKTPLRTEKQTLIKTAPMKADTFNIKPLPTECDGPRFSIPCPKMVKAAAVAPADDLDNILKTLGQLQKRNDEKRKTDFDPGANDEISTATEVGDPTNHERASGTANMTAGEYHADQAAPEGIHPEKRSSTQDDDTRKAEPDMVVFPDKVRRAQMEDRLQQFQKSTSGFSFSMDSTKESAMAPIADGTEPRTPTGTQGRETDAITENVDTTKTVAPKPVEKDSGAGIQRPGYMVLEESDDTDSSTRHLSGEDIVAMANRIRILQINAQSLAKKWGPVCMKIADVQPHIVGICEVWRLSSQELAEMLRICLPEYKLATRFERSKGRQGGGCLILIHRSMLSSKVSIGVEGKKYQQRGIEISIAEVQLATRRLRLAEVYFPQLQASGSVLKIKKADIKWIAEQVGDGIIMGDMNAQDVEWWPAGNGSMVSQRIERGDVIANTMREVGLTIVGGHVATHKSGSCLDLCYAGIQGDHLSAVSEDYIGDHRPVVILLDAELPTPHKREARNNYAKLTKVKEEKYRTSVDQQMRHGLELIRDGTLETPSDVVRFIREAIFDASKDHIPRTKGGGERKMHDTEWADEAAADGIPYAELTKDRNEFFRRSIGNIRENAKLVYKKVRLLGPEAGEDTTFSKLENPTCAAKRIGESFNHKMTDQERGEEELLRLENLRWIRENFTEAIDFAEEEARAALAEVEDKHGGADGIDSKQILMIQRLESVIEIVTALATMISRKGLGGYPGCWRLGIVRPLPKQDSEEFRPISMLCVLDKIIQTMFEKRIYSEVSRIVCPQQYGSQRHLNATQCLCELADRCIRNQNEQKRTAVLSIDFRQAFDRVPRQRLIAEMIRRDFHPALVVYASAFLSKRESTVELRAWDGLYRCDPWVSELGVVQGSALGPTLFLLYINSLLEELNRDLSGGGRVALGYCDDITILIEGESLGEIVQRSQAAADIVQQWSKRNAMPINTLKTKIMAVTSTTKKSDMAGKLVDSVYVCGKAAQEVEVMKILGVKLDCQLKFVQHVEELATRLAKRSNVLQMLAKQQWGPSLASVRTLYRSFVESLTRYSVPVWYRRTTGRARRKVEVIMNRTVRTILGLWDNVSTDVLYRLADLPNLADLYRFETCLAVDRALRKPRHGLGFYMDKVRKSGSSLGETLQDAMNMLDSHFPAAKFYRLPFPELKSYAHLVCEFGRINFMAQTIENQADMDELERSSDLSIFSDGGVKEPCTFAKDPNRSAGAFVVKRGGATVFQDGFYLGVCNHSFGAERAAATRGAGRGIQQAAEFIEEKHVKPRVLLATDSLSLVMALKSRSIKIFEDLQLMKNINSLATIADLTISHVRGHAEICGNEEADALCTEVLRSPAMQTECCASLLPEAVKSELKRHAEGERSMRIRSLAVSRPAVARAVKICGGEKLTRSHLKTDLPVVASRIGLQCMAGHCGWLLGRRAVQKVDEQFAIDVSGCCRFCGEKVPDRVEHFIQRCEVHKEQRRTLENRLRERVEDSLKKKRGELYEELMRWAPGGSILECFPSMVDRLGLQVFKTNFEEVAWYIHDVLQNEAKQREKLKRTNTETESIEGNPAQHVASNGREG